MSRFDQCTESCTSDCGHCKGRPVAALREELRRWESGQRRKGLPVVESVPDGVHYAALLVRSIGTEGGEEFELDDLLCGAAVRLKALSDAASYLLAERQRDRLIIEVARAWRQAGIWAIGHPPDFTAMQETKVALIEAIDRAYPGGGS